MIIHVIADQKQYEELYEQGFGRYVTKRNAEELISVLESGEKD